MSLCLQTKPLNYVEDIKKPAVCNLQYTDNLGSNFR